LSSFNLFKKERRVYSFYENIGACVGGSRAVYLGEEKKKENNIADVVFVYLL